MSRSRWQPPDDSAEAKRRREREQNLADIVTYGTEEDFVAAVKAYTPDISKEKLLDLIMQFRAAVREKRGLH